MNPDNQQAHIPMDADGTEALCSTLYGRPAQPQDYLGGSDAAMLHDAVRAITTLRSERDALLAKVSEEGLKELATKLRIASYGQAPSSDRHELILGLLREYWGPK